MNTATKVFRYMALTGYLGMLGSILAWNTIIEPSEKYPVALILIILLTPLLFALRGLLHGRLYTHAWSSLLSIMYFVIGIADAYSDPVDRPFGFLLMAFSLMLFVGAIFFVKHSAKARSLE